LKYDSVPIGIGNYLTMENIYLLLISAGLLIAYIFLMRVYPAIWTKRRKLYFRGGKLKFGTIEEIYGKERSEASARNPKMLIVISALLLILAGLHYLSLKLGYAH